MGNFSRATGDHSADQGSRAAAQRVLQGALPECSVRLTQGSPQAKDQSGVAHPQDETRSSRTEQLV
jgi:hypothetical protein